MSDSLFLAVINFPIYYISMFICLKLHWINLPTQGKRTFFYIIIISIIFVTANSMLASLGFGSGKSFTDWQNTLLCSFWAGGLSVFLTQIFIWIEVAIRKRTDQ
ncbi:hypothetical protein [Granulosicoccus antarcticus]|uniref:Uncharacterized protein n=1 Tax=Granulosicoccus antarcticus IMCC3135 TaxID=1192854 RepID=A0A2Z2NIW7_9GAMM|nr:hypothetical protein [Granulosicoccus antarcticus]ASJ71013.1 hypothetical protein IMCC3135_04500 [Granulosicoccus antarcticus IMCC3135]